MLVKNQWLINHYNTNPSVAGGLAIASKYAVKNDFFSFCCAPGASHYFQSFLTYGVLLNFFIRNLRNYRFYQRYLGFVRYRFVLFSGLGYKRRLFRRFSLMFSYIGDRHWILYKFNFGSLVGPHRRRNYVFFGLNKGQLTNDYSFFSSLRKPYVYKMKGFLDTRVRGRFLFVRRIKIRGVKTKLSKKQKLL